MAAVSIYKNRATRGMSLAAKLAFYSRSQSEGCILWAGKINQDGYGHLRWRGRHHNAHRLAWENRNGAVPSGHFVCHRCDVRSCINPAHLFVDTPAGNSADMKRKNRQAKGTRVGNARLTDEIVRAIRAAPGRQEDIARQFGVSTGTVSNVRTRLRWGHVD